MLGNRKTILRELIKALHAGAQPDEMKEKFKEALKDVGPLEIPKVEEELIKEGMPREGPQSGIGRRYPAVAPDPRR